MHKLIRFDWAMKKLLRSKANFNILAGFISEVLREDITILEILDSGSNKEDAEAKFNRVDMLIRDSSGVLVIIEVQGISEPDYLLRMLFATSKAVTEHIAEGDDYAEVKKVISINIVYFDLGHGNDYVYRGYTTFYGLHTGHELELNERQKEFYQRDTIAQLYPEYYILKVNQFDDVAKNTLDEWIYFLKNEEIPESFTAKGLGEAKQLFDIMRMKKEERAVYESYVEALRTKSSLIKGNYRYGEITGRIEGLAKGREEGLAIGREEGLRDSVKRLMANSMSEAEARRLLGL